MIIHPALATQGPINRLTVTRQRGEAEAALSEEKNDRKQDKKKITYKGEKRGKRGKVGIEESTEQRKKKTKKRIIIII